ncbi:MAG: hypothetical protein E3K36_14560 [Candidatus Brocadia sp.]|nr:hypothetical protein [Candidatus Brocadia sp.]
MQYINTYYFKNKVLRKYIVWYFVIFILAFVSHARADDREIASLFTPVALKNESVVTAAIPESYQDIIVNAALLKTESEEQYRIRIDFLHQSIMGGVIPPEYELQKKMDVIPGVSQGIDGGTFFDVLVLYTKGFAETYPGDELYAQISLPC